MCLKVYKQNLVKNGPEVSEKSKFYFSYINGLGPRSRYDLDLQYSCTFLNSNSCLHPSTFMSQAATVSENPLFALFLIEKSTLPNLTLS